MIIDGTNLILGRLATFAAKKALEGESVIVLNCEKVIVTGNRKSLMARFKEKRNDVGGPIKGPFYPKTPDRVVRRAIRGMLPFKQDRGRRAYKRVKCFKGIPETYSTQKIETIESAHYSKLKTLNFITVNDLSSIYGKDVAQ